MEKERDDAAECQEEEAVDADVKAGEDVELSLQERGDLDDLVLGPHEIGGHGHGSEDDADRKKHLIQRARVVETAVEGAFEYHPCEGRYDKGHGQAIEEGNAPPVQHHDSDVSAQHGECAVGKIDEVHDAERDAEADGEQEEQRPGRNSIEQDRQHGNLNRRLDGPTQNLPSGGTAGMRSNSTLNRWPFTRFTSRI